MKKPSNITDEINTIINNLSTPNSLINFEKLNSSECHKLLYPMAFKRILGNLITNAIRYGENNPILITLNCDNNKTIIQVKDNGLGIPEKYREKVFQPFYRLEKSRNTGTGGSGLGLAIVRQLANSHNWSITLEPRKNGGTKATIVIVF